MTTTNTPRHFASDSATIQFCRASWPAVAVRYDAEWQEFAIYPAGTSKDHLTASYIAKPHDRDEQPDARQEVIRAARRLNADLVAAYVEPAFKSTRNA